MTIEASSPWEAEKLAFEMCNSLRIYNPVAHVYRIKVLE
jgi:phosphoribosylformylglycinamidine (FGAM) synthase PurS component